VYPALAVAAAYQTLRPDAEVTFLGTELGFEGKLVPAAGFKLELIPGSPLFGSGITGKLRAVANTLAGMRAARRVFERMRTEALLSFGSYASAGPVLAARRLRLPIAICEPNVAPGLSNRLLARFADEIFLGWRAAAGAFRGRHVTVTGIPIRRALAEVQTRTLHRQPGATRMLILGGSLGSSFLNRRAPEVVAELARRGHSLEVLHQTGASGAGAARGAYSVDVAVTITPFVDDIVGAYAWADLAISSAGAITLAELAAAAVPVFLVPLAAASEDHQTANARAFAAITGCPWTSEHDWELTRVADDVESLMRAAQRGTELLARLQRAAQPDAALAIARACDQLIAIKR
jgi:UDP-N-acetylglucosamine--N-acetylmuramyl-(pentapeptide) pyrophosphoryl-undecaprenol N-acetylglucosamine transferase